MDFSNKVKIEIAGEERKKNGFVRNVENPISEAKSGRAAAKE